MNPQVMCETLMITDTKVLRKFLNLFKSNHVKVNLYRIKQMGFLHYHNLLTEIFCFFLIINTVMKQSFTDFMKQQFFK